MTRDEGRAIVAACDAATNELEVWTDIRDVPDAVLDALDAARTIAARYADAPTSWAPEDLAGRGDVCSRLVAFETEADRYVAASGRVAVRVETAAREAGETDARVLALASVLDRAREHERLAREYGDAEPREHGAQLRHGAVRLALAIETTAGELDGATVRAIVAAIQAAHADEVRTGALYPLDDAGALANAYLAGLDRAADIAAILGRGGRPAIEAP